jgi:hypothetical protein
MTSPDPKVVLQAHALRTAATRQALMHGRTPPRSVRGNRALWVSFGLAAGIAIVLIVVVRILAAVHH